MVAPSEKRSLMVKKAVATVGDGETGRGSLWSSAD